MRNPNINSSADHSDNKSTSEYTLFRISGVVKYEKIARVNCMLSVRIHEIDNRMENFSLIPA